MATVFFSYSHKDEELRDRLETHLAMLTRQGVIETWHDRRIVVGDEFAGRIGEELERADVILLLVSPDFLASNYCYDVEMSRAMDRHTAGEARVVPIILRHCDWHSAPFGKLQAAPRDGKPIRSWIDLDEAFLDVVDKIRAALKGAQKDIPEPRKMARSVRPPATDGPRSSNLRMKKTFNDADRDRFIEEAFEFMVLFFENSLGELKERNEGIDTAFRRVDANRFTAVVYKNGKALSRCKIQLGGALGGITYSHNDRAEDVSFNESLNVEADDQSLYLKALGMPHWRSMRERHLTYESSAEYYWSIFMRMLQGST